jgi:hypothetical protein
MLPDGQTGRYATRNQPTPHMKLFESEVGKSKYNFVWVLSKTFLLIEKNGNCTNYF